MKTDIAIIGAGIVGLATAWHLKRQLPGLEVSVIEKNARIAFGNSGKSAALYRDLFSSHLSRALASSSIAFYKDIAERIDLKAIGYLWTFNPGSWSVLRREAEKTARAALDASIIEGSELDDFFPGCNAVPEHRPAGAILGRNCGALSAQALAQWYADEFEKAGGQIITGQPVEGFILDSGVLASRVDGIRLGDGSVMEADRIILCTGAWTQDLAGQLGIASAVYPKKRQLFGFRGVIGALSAANAPGGSPLHSGQWGQPPGEAPLNPAIILPSGIYLKPIPGRDVVIVGLADDFGRSIDLPHAQYAGEGAEEEYFRAAIEPILLQTWPELAKSHPEGIALIQRWAGFYDYHLPDKNPVVEKESNLLWAAGSSGSGIMKADAIGRVTAGLALDMDVVELADGQSFNVSDLSLSKRLTQSESLII